MKTDLEVLVRTLLLLIAFTCAGCEEIRVVDPVAPPVKDVLVVEGQALLDGGAMDSDLSAADSDTVDGDTLNE